MRALYITTYLGNKGGLARYSHEIVKTLRARGINITVLIENNHMPLYDEKNILVSILRMSGFRKLGVFVINMLRCRREARDHDIVHACDGWPYAIYGYFSVIGTRRKLFISGIGTYTIAPLLESSIRAWLIRRAYTRASMIFCISDYVRDRIIELMPEAKAQTVFMGTTELAMISKDRVESYKHEFSIQNKYPIILSVGDIKDRKGQLDTLKAIGLLKSMYPHVFYVMVGSDADITYVDKIKKFIKEHHLEDNTKIVSGMYDDSILSFYYHVCDIFALNSTNSLNHFEGFGLVFLEAYQFGKPSVGSRGCGIESAIRDGYNGYLTNQGDAEDIASKMKSILSDDYKKFSSNASIFYKSFSWDKTVDTYVRAYKSI